MAAQNDKVIRLVLSDESIEFKFRVVCALNNQTFEERLEALIRLDILKNYREKDEWVTLQELLDELENRGYSISRPTLRSHRQNHILPTSLFVESKVVSDAPFANKNQKSYYKKQECVRFYIAGGADVTKSRTVKEDEGKKRASSSNGRKKAASR